MKWPKITKETPLEEIKRIHQRIWDYVIEHGGKPDTPYPCNCVACGYTIATTCNCYTCPISWPEDIKCSIFGSLYKAYCSEEDPEKKLELARQIRDIPFNYELEECKNV